MGTPEKLRSREKPSLKTYPLLLSQLTAEILTDMFTLYDSVANAPLALEHLEHGEAELEEVLDVLQTTNAYAWRFGSRIHGNAKLFIWSDGYSTQRKIQFEFYQNTDSHASPELVQQLLQMAEEFRDQANQYLLNRGLSERNRETQR